MTSHVSAAGGPIKGAPPAERGEKFSLLPQTPRGSMATIPEGAAEQGEVGTTMGSGRNTKNSGLTGSHLQTFYSRESCREDSNEGWCRRLFFVVYETLSSPVSDGAHAFFTDIASSIAVWPLVLAYHGHWVSFGDDVPTRSDRLCIDYRGTIVSRRSRRLQICFLLKQPLALPPDVAGRPDHSFDQEFLLRTFASRDPVLCGPFLVLPQACGGREAVAEHAASWDRMQAVLPGRVGGPLLRLVESIMDGSPCQGASPRDRVESGPVQGEGLVP